MGTREISWRVYTPSGLLLPQPPGQRTAHPYRASEIHTCPQERAKCRYLYTSILSRAQFQQARDTHINSHPNTPCGLQRSQVPQVKEGGWKMKALFTPPFIIISSQATELA